MCINRCNICNNARMSGDEGTQTLRRGLRIVGLVSEHPGIGLGEIAAALGVHKSTASRLCAALAQAGFLEPVRSGEEARATSYRLGLWLFVLGSRASAALALKQQAPPVMRHLAQQTGLPVYLSVPWSGLSLCIEEVPGPAGSVWQGSSVGVPHPLYATATGKLYLAGLADVAVRSRLAEVPFHPLAPNTRTEMDALLVDLAQIRQAGYAFNDQETEYGVRYLGVAVRDSGGEFLAGLTLGATVEQRTPAQLIEALPALRAAAETLGIRASAGVLVPLSHGLAAPLNGRDRRPVTR
jgi:IclR family transcriptional regulator, KDG regulon repressor